MVPEIQSATDNQNFEKLKKIPGDIIIYTCDHKCMVPEIPSTTDRIFCPFGPFFSPFYPLNNLKNKNFEKLKKNLKISSFYTGAPKIMTICYIVP